MPDPALVALVGSGYFARFHARAWQRIETARLVGLVAKDRDAGASLLNELGAASTTRLHDSITALAADTAPDVVDIVTPPQTHAALLRECLSAGVPTVICQKPFCTDLEEAEAIVREIEASDTTVVVHENFRFQPWYREIRSLLDAGALGELYQIRFDLRPGDGQGEDAYLDRQPYFREQPRFLIRETGVHLIDVFRYLIGEIDGLFARLARLNPAIAGEDAGTVLFEFANGVRGTLDGNRLADHAAENPRLVMGELTIEGSAATLTLSGDAAIRLRRHGERHALTHDYAFEDRDFGGDCVRLCQEHVLAHRHDGRPLVNTAADYLVNRRLEELVYRSHADGRWLDARGAR